MKRLLCLCFAFLATQALSMDISGQLQNASLENQTADPVTNLDEGRIFWDSDDDLFRFYTGSAWRTVADTTTTLSNPMTTAGDVIYGGASGTPTRLAVGAANYVLKSDGSNPSWGQISSTGTFASGAEATSSARGVVPSYETETSTGNSCTGCGTGCTLDYDGQRIGNLVTISVRLTTGTSPGSGDATCSSIVGTGLYPSAQNHWVTQVDAANDVIYVLSVNTSGTVAVYKRLIQNTGDALTPTNFTASTTLLQMSGSYVQ